MSSGEQMGNQEIIKEKILPSCKALSEASIQSINILLNEARASMSQREFSAHVEQWKIFAKKLNTNDKLLYLKQQNCRILIIELIKEEAMQLFNSSYLNRAKIDNQYIRYLKQLGPYFFIEVIMVVSKLKTIHKHFYKKLSSKMSENHIEIKILRILELCNQKKRSINNNKAKFLCIVEDQTDRLQITKQLGKMLRESWKRQKSKQPLNQIEQQVFQQYEIQQCQEQQMRQVPIVKQFAKHRSYSSHSNNDFNLQMLNDNMMDFSMLRSLRYRDSDSEEMLFYQKAM